MPLVSVLLPVRDGRRFVASALDSVLSQTHGELEVLVVDDGSVDATPALLEDSAASDPRVRVLTNPRPLGVAGALQVALTHARGALVARMDADDVCHPRRLELQAAFLAAHPEVVACGTATRHVDAVGRPLPALLRTVPLRAQGVRVCTAISTPMAHPTVVARTSVLRERGGYDPEAVLEDLDLWLRCGDLDLANLPQVLLDYRVHGANTTSSARARGAHALAPRLTLHLTALLEEEVPLTTCRLLLDPRSAAAATDDEADQAVDLLDRLVGLGGSDAPAVLDRALSTVAVVCAARGRAGLRPPALRGARHLTAPRVVRRLGRGAWVGARRALAGRAAAARQPVTADR